MSQSKLEANTRSRQKARENVRERVTIGFGFTSDLLRKWRECSLPISKRGNAKPMQTRITFDTTENRSMTEGVYIREFLKVYQNTIC